jgi:regulator of RNase E activity RraA
MLLFARIGTRNNISFIPSDLMAPIVEGIPQGLVMVDVNARSDVGLLGGNILMRLKVRGLTAAFTIGGMHDIPEIQELGIPVCCTAIAAPPSFAKLMLVDSKSVVTCGGVPVYPGDCPF